MCTLLILKCQTSNPAPIFSVCVKLCVRIGLSVGPVIQKGERYQGAWKGGGGKELASLAHIINILNIILVLSSSLDWCCHVAAVSACADAASAAAAAV